jgi:hypothetical protein
MSDELFVSGSGYEYTRHTFHGRKARPGKQPLFPDMDFL